MSTPIQVHSQEYRPHGDGNYALAIVFEVAFDQTYELVVDEAGTSEEAEKLGKLISQKLEK